MLLPCGAELVDRRSVYNVPTPSGIETWYPLAHAGLIYEVESQLRSAGFQLTGEHHALSHEGAGHSRPTPLFSCKFSFWICLE